jgi:hypothetical protein
MLRSSSLQNDASSLTVCSLFSLSVCFSLSLLLLLLLLLVVMLVVLMLLLLMPLWVYSVYRPLTFPLASRSTFHKPLQQSAATADFAVSIVACGPIPTGMVYAVGVTQPVQSWTVLRSHQDFVSVGQALQVALVGLPACPAFETRSGMSNLDSIIQARNDLQDWLTSILMYPGARESSAVRQFLTLGANTIPQQYENVVWTQFTPSQATSQPQHHHMTSMGNVADMEMDDMFEIDNDDGGGGVPDDLDEADEDYIPSASVRYKPTDEAITDEDELDMMAGEVEMVEDIGSLAQSLGASHLGRSLQLQREMKHYVPINPVPVQGGLNLGRVSQHSTASHGVGGLASAIAAGSAVEGFYQKTPVSAPRLDSFKMIKVIGKGSFGECRVYRCVAYQNLVLMGPIDHR